MDNEKVSCNWGNQGDCQNIYFSERFFGAGRATKLKMGLWKCISGHQRQARKKVHDFKLFFRNGTQWIFGTEVHLLVNSFISARERRLWIRFGLGICLCRVYFCGDCTFYLYFGDPRAAPAVDTSGRQRSGRAWWRFFCGRFLSSKVLDEVKLIGNRRPTAWHAVCFGFGFIGWVYFLNEEHLANCNNKIKITCRSPRRGLSHSVGRALHQLLLRRAGVSRILCRHGDQVPGWVLRFHFVFRNTYLYLLL